MFAHELACSPNVAFFHEDVVREQRFVQEDLAFLGILNNVNMRLVAPLVARVNNDSESLAFYTRHLFKNNLRRVGLSSNRIISVAVVLAALLACVSCSPEPSWLTVQHGRALPASCVRQPVHVTIIGDSLAAGYGASVASKNFAMRLSRYVAARRQGSTLVNLGIPGANTRRIAQQELPRLKNADCALVVVIAGANDVQQYVAPSRFGADYDALLSGIRQRAPRAALVVTNLPDVGLSRIIMPPVKPIISTLAAFDSNAIARAADKYGAWVVDLWTVSRLDARHRVQLLSRDGIHPNDEGYAVMAAAAYPMIDRAMR
jgi:lysophospholipase L1-like esterase